MVEDIYDDSDRKKASAGQFPQKINIHLSQVRLEYIEICLVSFISHTILYNSYAYIFIKCLY